MFFVLGVSTSFKVPCGVMEESDVESLFWIAKYKLLFNAWVVTYWLLILASLTGSEFKFLLILFMSFSYI